MFYPNTSSYQHKKPSRKKQNRIKISTQQYVRSCTTTVYVNLSMNSFEKQLPKTIFVLKSGCKIIPFPNYNQTFLQKTLHSFFVLTFYYKSSKVSVVYTLLYINIILGPICSIMTYPSERNYLLKASYLSVFLITPHRPRCHNRSHRDKHNQLKNYSR